MSSQLSRSGRVESTSTSHLMRTGDGAKSARDSLQQKAKGSSRPAPKRAYVTRSRVESIRGQLSGHQQATMSDVSRLGIVTGQQVQRLHYGSSPAGARLARKQLAQLVHWQVLTRLDRSVGGQRAGSSGYVYALGPTGQRIVDPTRSRYFPRWTPRPSYLRHALAVSELYVRLRESERTGSIDLIAYDTEPACWRRYFGPGGARSMLKPDALAVIGLTDYEYRYFVEVDCSTEHRPQITAKAKTYVRYWQSGREQAETGIFPFVLWVAPDTDRAGFLVDVLSSLPPEHWPIFMVTTAETAPHQITTGTTVPLNSAKEVT